MRSLVYYVATTIDGQIAASDGSTGAFSTDPEFMVDLHRTYADALPAPAQEAMGIQPPLTQWDTVLMGRSTFEVGLAGGVTSPYPHLKQFVFSASLDRDRYREVSVIAEDAAAFTRSLKQGEGGRIWLCGGGKLAASLAGQIDRLVVKLNPATIGSGIQLFDGPIDPIAWRLTGTRTFSSGVVLLEYERA